MSRFDGQHYLRQRKAWVDAALVRYLKDQRKSPPRLLKAMRYTALSEGKRIRPILTIAAGEVFGAQRKVLLPFACALELIHAYSLIHDDLPALDDDDYRRGELANHKVFGEGVALLAGDALLTAAFSLLSCSSVLRQVDPALAVALIHEIAAAAGSEGMVGGQIMDLEAAGRAFDAAKVEALHRYKTAALIRAAVRVGARLGGASPGDLGRLTRYGERLGLAFQITDDILDAAGRDGAEQSKGSEACAEKASYPSVVGLEAANNRARDLARACVREVEAFGVAADPLRWIAHHVVERKM